jgi:hypothetical protein
MERTKGSRKLDSVRMRKNGQKEVQAKFQMISTLQVI